MNTGPSPILPASAMRAGVCRTPRTSPVSPTSPNATAPGSNARPGVPRRARAPRQIHRRLVDPHTTPGDRDLHVMLTECQAARRSRTASACGHEQSPRRQQDGGASGDTTVSQAPEPRRAMAAYPRRGEHAGAGYARARSESSTLDGFSTPRSPSPAISKTPISLTEPNRFLVARTIRKTWSRSPSNDNTVSTVCSSTRGPATVPSW